MRQLNFYLACFLILFLGVTPLKAQETSVKCVILETAEGEMLEYYMSSHPRLIQNNDKVSLVSDAGSIELGTTVLKKVYPALATLKMTYKVDGEVYKIYFHHEGVKLETEPLPEKEGYTFSGWDTEPTVMPEQDVTVSGSFNVNKYKLTYKVDGEDYKSLEVEFGSAITPEAAPTKEGYTFSGWSEVPSMMPAQDVVVTGTFSINSYTVTYKIDGEVYSTETVEYGSTITPPTVADKPGYDFAWEEYPTTMPAQDITINGTYTTGISNIDNGIGITTNGGDIFITGLQPNEVVKVYSLAGELLLSAQATAQGNLTIARSFLVPGVNIIKTNSQTYKITKQ